MKKIILLFIFISISSCISNDNDIKINKNITNLNLEKANNLIDEKQNDIDLIYTVTDFKVIRENNFNNHFDSQKAKSSKIYKINFIDRENYSRELITESDDGIVYHDFCKSPEGIIYATGGEFGLEKGTARIVQVYPKVKNKILQEIDEIRIRDCSFIKDGDKTYIGMITHGEGEVIIFDKEKKSIIDNINSEYSLSYTGVTMIHEVVTSDLNGDGIEELYFGPTTINKPTYEEQKGKIYKLEKIDGKYIRTEIDDLGNRYAKEMHQVELNGKKAIIISQQGQTTIVKDDEKGKITSNTSRNGTKRRKSKGTKTILKTPVEMTLYHNEEGKIKKEYLGKIETDQCRVIETGNFGYDGLGIIVGCKNGTINFYSLNSFNDLEFKDSFNIPNKQIHSFFVTNTDDDEIDEIFIGVDLDGLYHLDLGESEENKLFKLYDYSGSRSWIWAISGI